MMIFKNDNFIIFRKFSFLYFEDYFNDETNLRVRVRGNGCKAWDRKPPSNYELIKTHPNRPVFKNNLSRWKGGKKKKKKEKDPFLNIPNNSPLFLHKFFILKK